MILSRKDIDQIGERIAADYCRITKTPPGCAIEPMFIAEKMYGLTVEHCKLSTDGSILGLTVYHPMAIDLSHGDDDSMFYVLDGNTVLIEQALQKDPCQYGRYQFTLAHELSHQILHRMYPDDGVSYRKGAILYYRDKGRKVDNWDEWQANALASAILLPRFTLEACMQKVGLTGKIKKLQYPYGRRPMYAPQSEYEKFASVANMLHVSKSALAIRMRQFGYLENSCLEEYIHNPRVGVLPAI